MSGFFVAEGWGIGKAVEYNGASVTLEFFVSPVDPERPRKKFSSHQVQAIQRLEPQTRVFFIEPTSGVWRFGRLEWQAGEDCFIMLPNKHRAQVRATELFVRCDRGTTNTCDLLAARLTETPYFHSARAVLAHQLIAQRAAASGLTGLLSAPIELERHQIEVVRRVLSDPVQRYLLADEVGLGKTIEAGIILRQYVLDCPDTHCALVLTPPALVQQWENELRDRLQIGEHFNHRIFVVSWDELPNLPDDFRHPQFVIIDEAHQIGNAWSASPHEPGRQRFDFVCHLTHPKRCPRLLLLSATPVRRNEDSFLALLHLLDPLVYRLEDRESFRAKVEKRQDLADLFYAFTEDQQNLFLEDMVTQLTGLFPKDRRLLGLAKQLLPHLSLASPTESQERQDGIRAIRTHLHETYRLHRRVLRNRRSEELAGLLPGRGGLTVFHADGDSASGQIADALENWRSGATASLWGREATTEALSLGRIYSTLLEASFCDPHALLWCVRERMRPGLTKPNRFGPLTSPEKLTLLAGVPYFKDEKPLLREILATEPGIAGSEESQWNSIQQEVSQRFRNGVRIVLFASSPDRADRAYKRLKASNSDGVFRHSLQDEAWRAFLARSNGLLVCDYRAEEGLNLQGGRTSLLHLDFPLSPNRLEQRMGRLDRFGVGFSVESLGFLPLRVPILKSWVDCLTDAWQVFSRSIAALQFLVEDSLKTIHQRLLPDAEQAIRDEASLLAGDQGRIAKELQSLRAQDELDSVDLVNNPEEDIPEKIQEWEDQSSAFQRSLESWLLDRLRFIRVGQTGIADKVVRYHFRSSESGHQTLVPKKEFARWFMAAVEIGARHERFLPPLTWPIAYERQTARHRNVGIARLGSPLVDCLQNYLRWDDRGMTFAFWREVSFLSLPKVEVFFRFDFTVEVDTNSIEKALGKRSELAPTALRRLADAAFPPMILTIWLDENCSVPEDPTREQVLAKPYQKLPDVNLSQDRWPLVEPYYSLDGWPDLCRAARDRAESLLFQKTDLRSVSATRARKVEERLALLREQFGSRINALTGSQTEVTQTSEELELQELVQTSLVQAIRQPAITVNSAGAVFLAGMPLQA
jgi:ATP-dependent helicase HepA